MKEFIVKVIKGIIVGIAAMTAGAGTFAIILGIYDRCMEIISNPFKGFKDNLKYIFPILLGIGISAIFFGNFVIYCLNEHNALTRCVFLGIIIGGVPTLFKIANKKGFKRVYIVSMFIALLFTILLTWVANNTKAGETVSNLSTVELLVYGAIYSFGAVMPGMTTIHILIYMGVLPTIMSGFFALDFSIIIPFGIGYILLALLTANLITFLFKKFYGMTYYAIIGFSITSLVMFVPNFNSIIQGIIGTIIVVVFTVLVFLLTRIENKYTKVEKSEGLIDEK
ncbi:MAG: DUF368 domain-containing protein [Clostridia bacterium]|nr:DUF368 domain-containing protein [Clostridia bacterium]